MVFKPLNLPMAELKMVRRSGIIYVRCLVRNKEVVLTPEEWVRQHVLNYLIIHAGYPKGMIAVERALSYNGGIKRCDILILHETGSSLMIVECKSPEVKVNEETFYQAAKYDNILNAACLLVTNGLKHVSFLKSKTESTIHMQEGILSWQQMKEL